jgi:hypothetical protein
VSTTIETTETPAKETQTLVHDPDWHREYSRLELAASNATDALRAARKLLNRKRIPAGAQEAYDAALIVARDAGSARWNFEMVSSKIFGDEAEAASLGELMSLKDWQKFANE